MTAQIMYSALVVDDEAVVRTGTMRALSRCGFTCTPAANGKEASELLAEGHFEVVVTDLRMPEKNGHTLAVELASQSPRPVIVVLTGVSEPKLTHDLLARGVDDIQFKPVQYDVFAQRVRSLVEAKAKATAIRKDFAVADFQIPLPRPSHDEWANVKPVEVCDVVSAINGRSHTPPADFDGFSLSSSNSLNVQSLAAAIEAQPGLATEVLRLANGAFYKSAERIHELEQASRARPSPASGPTADLNTLYVLLGGIGLGWLLSWIGASVLLFKG